MFLMRYVFDYMGTQLIQPLMLDALNLSYIRNTKVPQQLRTDELVQNVKTSNFNSFQGLKFAYKSINHSDPKHPWVNPEDKTINTQGGNF